MLGIKVNSGYLDLPPDTSFTLEMHSPAFLGGDIEIIPGAFSIPITIPLSDHNIALLGIVSLVENTEAHPLDVDSEIWWDGKFLFRGLLTVRSATNRTARIYIIINEAKGLRDITLQDLDLGGVRDVGGDALAHAKDTAENPLDYDYIFFPVQNLGFWDQSPDNDPETDVSNFHNYYDRITQEFVEQADAQIATPFIRVDYLLSKLFSHAVPYHFINNWQTTDELKKLVLYNNKSIYINDVWGDIDLSRHVPDENGGDFFKKICRAFCLAPFVDYFNNTITLESLRDIIAQPNVHDWTSKASHAYEITTEVDYPGSFCHLKDPEADGMFKIYGPPTGELIGEEEILLTIDEATHATGLYYITSENSYYYFNPDAHPTRQYFFITKDFKCVDLIPGREKFELEIPPLFMVIHSSFSNPYLFPECRIPGSHDDYGMQADFMHRMIFYRGMYGGSSPALYPFASNNVYDFDFNVIAEYALLWNTQYGLFEKWWKQWYHLLQNKKEITLDLNLHITDILNFRFQDKIRIRNMNYFVKRLRITFRGSRMTVQGLLCSTT